MIQDIPTDGEFYETGQGLLDVAWSTVVELLGAFRAGQYEGQADEFEEYQDDFWKASQRRLSTSLTIMQQGVEFILKGRVASVSSFLLLKGPPESLKQNGNFADHVTIDAKDLVNLHNAVCRDNLSEEFIRQFHSFRSKRNALMHSVSTKLPIDAIEILRMILFFHHEMFPNERWSRVRQRFVDTEPETVAYAADFVVDNLCSELEMVIGALKPADVKKYFLIDKKARRYYCPTCLCEANHDYDFEIRLAVLRTQGNVGPTLYCPVCDKEISVQLRRCSHDNCKGNLFGFGRGDEEICLLCGCAAPE